MKQYTENEMAGMVAVVRRFCLRRNVDASGVTDEQIANIIKESTLFFEQFDIPEVTQSDFCLGATLWHVKNLSRNEKAFSA